MKSLVKIVKSIIVFCAKLVLGESKVKAIRHKKYLKEKNQLIQQFGPEALSVFNKIANEEGVDYWLFWGSLLGAYRDKGFIKHDDDIDIGMFDNEISIRFIDRMIGNGFKVIWAIVDKDFVGGYHLACTYKEVKFDIYSFHKDNENKVSTVFCPLPYNDTIVRESTTKTDVMHIRMDSWEHLDKIPFEGVFTFIPCNADKVLRSVYGDDYMTPIADKKAQDNAAQNKIVEDHNVHYACMMSYEVFKMFKSAGLI